MSHWLIAIPNIYVGEPTSLRSYKKIRKKLQTNWKKLLTTIILAKKIVKVLCNINIITMASQPLVCIHRIFYPL